MIIKPPFREADIHGQGHYHAPRGTRLHNGVDLVVPPKSIVCAIHPGRVTKLGYPYANDLSYRYVEITDPAGLRFRYFYVEPLVKMGDNILQHQEIGIAQDLQPRYKDITPHIHFEIIEDGEYINPTSYV